MQPEPGTDLSTLLAASLTGRGKDPALWAGGDQWTYDDLDRWTAERAAVLRARVEVGRRVVLLGEHTTDALLWALAIMRSGLIYTPVSPQLPPDRLREQIDLAAPALVIVCGSTDAAALPAVDVVSAAALAAITPPLEVPATYPVDRVAYSISTSGSAGRPKLVDVGHRGLAVLCTEQTSVFGLRAGDRVLQFSSLSFDASVAELLVSLYAGATLELPAWNGGSWVAAVAHHLRTRGSDIVTLPPSVYARLDDAACQAVGTVVFAGEALPRREYERAVRHSRVLNAYGPTEATVCFSIAEPRSFSTGIGRPLLGFDARVRDDAGMYRTAGRGELVIVGPGVALGYGGGDADNGAFAEVDGRPAYHTGDEVDLINGELYYVGRLDDQVKRLGHRLNLTHLQDRISRLLRTPAVVLLDGERLVVAHTATEASEADLRKRCRAALPAWEQPDLLLAVAEIPLTVAGKADRAAVLKLVPCAGPTDRANEGPMTASLDESLAGAGGTGHAAQVTKEIVERILGGAVDPETSVFDAGGTSFTLVQIQVELTEQFGEDRVQEAFEALDYDFSIARFARVLAGDGRDRGPALEAVVSDVAADLAVLPAPTRRSTARVTTVTGTSGFIGGHVLDRLLDSGDPAVVITGSEPERLLARHRDRFGRCEDDYAAVSIVPWDDLDRASGSWGRVVHMGFDVNHALPLARQLATSVARTREVVAAAAAHGARRFAFLSAASVGPQFLPLVADTLGAIGEPYSQAKFVAEAYAEALDGDFCTVDLLRAGLVYGHRGRERDLLERDTFATLLALSVRHGVLPQLRGSIPVCHVDNVVDALLAEPVGRGRRELLADRTYDTAAVRDELGFGPDQVVPAAEWLETVTAADALDQVRRSALAGFVREDVGWPAAPTPGRPILRDLIATVRA